jgi:2-oxoglutarate ferredoxin oxidoreductase subunit gamma
MGLRICFRFSGASGYSLIQAARILAEAAAVYGDKYATESCSYGPEARGSASRAEVIVSDESIDYPKPDVIDYFVVLSQEAYDKYGQDVKPGGIIIADDKLSFGDQASQAKIYLVSLTELIEKELSQPQLVNIVILGFLSKLCDCLEEKAVRQAILARVPKKSEAAYIEAFDKGVNLELRHYKS